LGLGPDLVLLHGWGVHSGIWRPLKELLAAYFHVTLVDLPGHGWSAPLPQGERLDVVAEAVAAVAPPHAFWLGWSLGGLVALQVAISHPARVDKLVLVASTPRFTAASDWPNAIATEILAGFSEALQEDFAGTLKRFVLLQTRGAERAKEVARTLFTLMPPFYCSGGEGLGAGLILLRDSDLRVNLSAVCCPTLMIMGQHDTLVPARVGDWMSTHLRQGRACTIAGAGHAPFLSHHQAFWDILRNFLEA
jgi:pimeloyl-[acyl-carrier protein] methyl ester esterase